MFATLSRVCAAVAISLSPMFAMAGDLATPQNAVILEVSGAIANTNDGDKAVFDLDMLMALGSETIETTTIWTEGEQSFTGVRLGDLMAAIGASEGAIKATAINDYSVEIPFDDAAEMTALVAYHRNGETMSVRDKGPLWIVYNYDSDARFQSEVYYSRSIWQLNRIEVQP